MATVNYHVQSAHRPTYQIDAGGVTGKIVSPEHVETTVRVKDVRSGEASVSFSDDAVMFEHLPTGVTSFEQGDWRATYDRELASLLKARVGAHEVLVFDHTIREDDRSSSRRPARNVHTDYSPEGARQRLTDLLGETRAAEWARGHYAFINLWRPIGHRVNSAPLGFVRPSSVSPEDWVSIDLIYPDRTGHIMGLCANDRHEWVYCSRMGPDELAWFNIFDSRGLPSVAHSALNLVEDDRVADIRRSIESRTLVRY
ncbi:MAG: CmcJ/NvfI family oxidoreductase [Myxococcota bacterium]